MTDNITTGGPWKPGQCGNPKGRPRRKYALTELLRAKGQETVVVGGEEKTAQEVVAEAVWHLAIHGEVWLAGRRLEAESVTEWAALVKWLYTHIEPPNTVQPDDEPELLVRVVREEKRLSAGEKSLSTGDEMIDIAGDEIIEIED